MCVVRCAVHVCGEVYVCVVRCAVHVCGEVCRTCVW